MTVICSGGCKRQTDDPSSWVRLELTGRYRCHDCDRELVVMSKASGTESSYQPDPLPPESRGALKELRQPPPLKESVRP